MDREKEWAKLTGFFSDDSKLSRLHDNSVKEYKRVINAECQLDTLEYWNTDVRKEDFEILCNTFDKNDIQELLNMDEQEMLNEELNEKYNNVVLSKELISDYKRFLQKKKQEIVHVFTTCCENAIKKNEKRLRALQNIKEEEETDVFSAIANDNMNRFLDCFSNGVDLTKCNSQGYSPLTYVAKNSNNAMMKFLIDHEVDLSLKDKNGYNALETAAIYHCQDICELLINADKGLLMESQSLTKLAANDRFENWISNF